MNENNKNGFRDETISNNEYEDDGIRYFDGSNEFQSKDNDEENTNKDEGASLKRKKLHKAANSGRRIKKRWIVLGIIFVLIVGSIIWDKIDKYDQIFAESYDWPQSKMAQMLPEPENKILSISEDEGKSLDFDVVATSEDCKNYIEKCKEKGFVEKSEASQSSGNYDYVAYNSDGYKLEINNYESMREMDVNLYSPEYLKELEANKNAAKKANNNKNEEMINNDQSDDIADSSSSDFRETMDSYEAFMDEYISFMETYKNSGSTVDMIDDYNDMLNQYNEFSQKIDNIDEESLSDEDYDYYIEVTSRVSSKLLKASL